MSDLIEQVAKAVFMTAKPDHILESDWDSGAVLGADNAYRNQCYEIAKAAINALIEAEWPDSDHKTGVNYRGFKISKFSVERYAKALLKQAVEGHDTHHGA